MTERSIAEVPEAVEALTNYEWVGSCSPNRPPLDSAQWARMRVEALEPIFKAQFLADFSKQLFSTEAIEAAAKAAHEMFGIYSWEETAPEAQATNRKACRTAIRAALTTALKPEEGTCPICDGKGSIDTYAPEARRHCSTCKGIGSTTIGTIKNGDPA